MLVTLYPEVLVTLYLEVLVTLYPEVLVTLYPEVLVTLYPQLGRQVGRLVELGDMNDEPLYSSFLFSVGLQPWDGAVLN